MFDDNYRLIAPLQPKNTLANTQLWQAVHLPTQKKVVIKQLLSDFSPLQYQQFYQENLVYQTLENLNPSQKTYFFNILNAKISAQENWLIFEHYQGQTLKQALAENSLNFPQKIAYLIELCHALDALHSQGFIHSDIKPSNVFISENQLKLFDFGLAKNIDNLSPQSQTAGTPAYMSPEQFNGDVLTYQSDYYSLGILMYETLVGKKPFLATTLESWAIQHCQTSISPIDGFSAELNCQLNSLFDQLLAKFPYNRPKNLAVIKNLLENLQKLKK